MSCERCEVVNVGAKCTKFEGPHKFCHTCGRRKGPAHAKAPKLSVIEGGIVSSTPAASILARVYGPPRFPVTYCSMCGAEFGPRDHGYSHCEDHS